MRRLYCILLLGFMAVCAQAQPFSLYSYSRDVHILDNTGKERVLRIGMDLSRDDRVTVLPSSSLSIHNGKDDRVLVLGACTDKPVELIARNRRYGFMGRLASMLVGPESSERAYVSYKGDDPVPEFVFASHEDAYRSAYDIELRVRDAETRQEVTSTLHEGQMVYFEVINREEFPLCIGILWRDSEGGVVDCLGGTEQFVLIPADSSLDLSDFMMEVAPPLGMDNIFLFAATDFFHLGSFSRIDESSRPDHSSGKPVGFMKKQFRIR